MFRTFVDSALEDLSRLESYRPLANYLEGDIQDFHVDLRLLQMFLRFLFTWDPYQDIDRNLLFHFSSTQTEWGKSGEGLYAAARLANDQGNSGDWFTLVYNLQQNIEYCKDEIKKYCVHLKSCSLQCEPFASDQILEFIDEIIHSLKHLHLSMENQIETLKQKLLLLRNSVDFVAGSYPNVKDSRDFLIHAHAWASKVACLTCLHWARGVEEDDEIGSRMNVSLIDLLRKVNPCNPEFIGMCFEVLKLTKSSCSDTFVFSEFVTIFVDLLLENLQDTLKDDIEILREGLIFLISFLADPPAEDFALTSLRSHTDALLGEASHLICLFNKTEEGLTGDKASLFDVLRKIHDLRRQIEKLHVRLPDFSLPRTNRLWFVENLLSKIEDLTRTMNCNQKIAPFYRFQFAKDQIFGVKEGLMSLSRSIHVVWELQNEHEELKDVLDLMIIVAYKAELAVNSSFTIDHPIWYHLSCLSYVLGEIKDVQNEYVKFKTNQIYGTASANATAVVSILPSVNIPPVSGFDEVVVGFDDEKQVLIDRITRGTKHLDVVPIVGMGGLGKTTLAKKLFNESSVTCDFNVRAFCHVGQEHSSRLILLDILNELSEIDNKIRAMTKDDLADRLRKCLKGRKYLIIMDDIWNVDAWQSVKNSFPEDNNGSRVVFTTRINNVALQAKAYCTPHYLRFLSIDESWGLLQAKVFHEHHCPPHLQEVGMLIAEKCNGLPLAVVVIAGLLAKMSASLSSWNGVVDDLTSYASTLGCMETLELSYRHLPEALKSCLLYFGAFVKEKNISAKRLMLLWAAEGFVPKPCERNNFLSMANQYLNNLIDRSLVIVHKRSSTGGIKQCYVHDLIRDLCQTKARDEQFFHFIPNGSEIFSNRDIYEQYRLCSHVQWMRVGNAKARRGHSTAHTLLYYPISDKYLYKVDLPYSSFKLLQVLDLQDAYRTHSHFPEEVTMLVNLRYMALLVGFIHRVPSKIINLWNLETFILRSNHWERFHLPQTIWKMKRLRHVDAGDNSTVDLDNDVGKDSSKLPNVESFSSVTIANGESGEELLRRLSGVRKLKCRYPSPCWDGVGQKFELLPKLDEYLTVLKSLHIASRGVRYPCELNFPVTLKKLTLRAFALPWSEISKIAKLPCLEVLKLLMGAFSGSRWDAENEEFPNLKFLKLHMLDVADWIASVDTFPCLEQLIVIKCDNLVEIPVCFGEVSTLKAIEIYNCKKGLEESAIQIQNEQLEIGNQSLQVRVKP